MTNSLQAFADTEEKTETRTCPKHGEYEARLMWLMDRWIGGNCPKCAEEAQTERDEWERQQKERDRLDRIKRLIGNSGIPKRFESRTLESYIAENEGQKRALAISQRMAGSDPADGVSLVFCGKPGTGKTHLACGIGLRWAQQVRPVMFSTVLAAIRKVKSTYSRNSDITEEQAISGLTEIDLLILDEVGVQLGSEHELMLLFEIINERYQQMRPTILISNLTQRELSDYLGDRVMDRFRENGAVVAFDWESHRGKAK